MKAIIELQREELLCLIKRKWLSFMFISTTALALSACQMNEAAVSPSATPTVAKGVGWIDYKKRRQEIASSGGMGRALCPAPGPRTFSASSVNVTGHGTQYNILNMPNKFDPDIRFIDSSISGWLATGDPRYLEGLKGWMIRSANAGSFTNIVPDPDRFRYLDPLFNLRFTLKPTFMAYDLLSQTDQLSVEENNLVKSWLENVVTISDKGGCEMVNYCDNADANHTTLHRGTTFMLWGAVSNNRKWMQKGVAHFKTGLGDLRDDGSNQHDVVPKKSFGPGGDRALRKQNQVVGYLVMIADIGEQHGYSLYNTKIGGSDLFDAFEFLVNGLEDDSVVRKHTGVASHDDRFLTKSRHPDETVAWFEVFASRYPNHPLTARFSPKVTAKRPIISEAYGGNLSCFAGSTRGRFR